MKTLKLEEFYRGLMGKKIHLISIKLMLNFLVHYFSSRKAEGSGLNGYPNDRGQL